MRYRLIDLFKWMTAIAVVCAIMLWYKSKLDLMHGSRPDVYELALFVWLPIAIFGSLLIHFFASESKNRRALVGMFLCGVVAYTVAYCTDFGLTLYEWTHPEGQPVTANMVRGYGCRMAAMAGAFMGALIGGMADMIARRHIRESEPCAASSPSSLSPPCADGSQSTASR